MNIDNSKRKRHGTTPLIHAARAIVRGDISRAYTESERVEKGMATVTEARALAGACRVANAKWGSNLRWIHFVGYK